MKDRIALGLAAAAGILHLAFANRYDLFRDELYFIVCGSRPQWGYADQPPLVPLVAAALWNAGHQVWLVRLPSALAAAALVYLTVRFARALGGGDAAAWAAGLPVAFGAMFLGITATLNTTTFEPAAWTAVALLLYRAATGGDPRGLLAAGAIAGVAMEAKYALPLWLAALFAGLLLTPERRVLARRELWLGLLIAVLIALPSLAWQAANGLPFRALVAAAAGKNVAAPPGAFALGQLLAMNPLWAPLWLTGLLAPFALTALRPARFLSIAFLLTAAVTVAQHGKDYYLAPAYPPLFALGAVVLARDVRAAWKRAALLAPGALIAILAAPVALPILDPPVLSAYVVRLGLVPEPQEKSARGIRLPQTFLDMLGWHDFVREIGTAWQAIPPERRARTALLFDNYGEAAAIDVYGAAYGFPPALSGHNQYGLWALRGQHPVDVLRAERHIRDLRPYCGAVEIAGVTAAAYAMPYENGKTIAICRNLRPALETLWPRLRQME